MNYSVVWAHGEAGSGSTVAFPHTHFGPKQICLKVSSNFSLSEGGLTSNFCDMEGRELAKLPNIVSTPHQGGLDHGDPLKASMGEYGAQCGNVHTHTHT